MGVAFGKFLPTKDFALLRHKLTPVENHTSEPRYFSGLSAWTENGVELICSGGVALAEWGGGDEPLQLEVSCLGIEQPPYDELFTTRREAHDL